MDGERLKRRQANIEFVQNMFQERTSDLRGHDTMYDRELQNIEKGEELIRYYGFSYCFGSLPRPETETS